MKSRKFKTNILYYYASQYVNKPVSTLELEKIDMTNEFWKELIAELKSGEIITININAKPRLGKTTVAFAIASIIKQEMINLKITTNKEPFGMKNIARDQQEYSKMMRNPETKNTVIVTDESNALENTGENISAEEALNKVFSDVQAGRYVHRVCCSPKEIIDPNADILLEVISQDKERRITHCKLYYRFNQGGIEIKQLLGYVNVYVGDIISNWEDNVKKIFYKENKSEKDIKFIENSAKKDWYVYYITKKYEKMELITEEGIMRPRELDYAEVILEVKNKLKNLAKIGMVNREIISNYVENTFRKYKMPLTIIGMKLSTDRVMGVLSIYKSYYKMVKDLETINKVYNTLGKPEKEMMEIKITEIKEIIQDLLEAIKIQEVELEKYVKINKKYNETY